MEEYGKMQEYCKQANREADRIERAKRSGMPYEQAIDLITDHIHAIDQMAADIQAYIRPRACAC